MQRLGIVTRSTLSVKQMGATEGAEESTLR